MNKTEILIKEYSSKKLKEIIEQQSASYNENFIDYAKDELIRRGELFTLNVELEKEIAAMNDNDLKKLVEQEWDNFHLEYVEIARKEYLKRGFKNVSNESEETVETSDENNKRYPALRAIINTYVVFAWICGIALGLVAVFGLLNNQPIKTSIGALILGALIVVGLRGAAESIRVFIDIEENTRKKQ